MARRIRLDLMTAGIPQTGNGNAFDWPGGDGVMLLESGGNLAAPVQTAPSTATTGGSIAAGTYYGKITYTNANGETIGSNEQSIVTTGATSTITWNWGAPPAGATNSKVYVGTTPGGENVVQTVAAPAATVTMTVLPGTAGTPPAANTAMVPVNLQIQGPGGAWVNVINYATTTDIALAAGKMANFRAPAGSIRAAAGVGTGVVCSVVGVPANVAG